MIYNISSGAVSTRREAIWIFLEVHLSLHNSSPNLGWFSQSLAGSSSFSTSSSAHTCCCLWSADACGQYNWSPERRDAHWSRGDVQSACWKCKTIILYFVSHTKQASTILYCTIFSICTFMICLNCWSPETPPYPTKLTWIIWKRINRTFFKLLPLTFAEKNKKTKNIHICKDLSICWHKYNERTFEIQWWSIKIYYGYVLR